MKYRPLMILGAGSDVGKSIITAALCRIFHREGIDVAPFKAQNMALNSFITPEGGEMGRAQVVQARASGLEPHVDMNPILLKPTGDRGSQVIVNGKVYGNFTALEYYAQKGKLVRKVMDAFKRLSDRHELVIMEGAGSAVELNLKKSDLVNFHMAKRAGAAAILVADIDRGGVFASTIGSHMLLTRGERQLLAGFIVNKFRGEPRLFEDGVDIIEKRTGKPVFGVVPYIKDMGLPEEDSVALERHGQTHWNAPDTLNIGVIRLPRISNYTDFDPLEREPGVALRYLDRDDSAKGAHLLVIPGSKNTIEDLRYLKESGFYEQIVHHASIGGRVVGICGGYQMLGEVVRDPLGVEGPPSEEEGLGLLPVETIMAGEKTTTQVTAIAAGFDRNDEPVKGYEIHMGETKITGPGRTAFRILDRNGHPVEVDDGWMDQTDRVWGAYIHGVFDNDGFRRALLDELRREVGVEPPEEASQGYEEFLESRFEALADRVQAHLDMDAIRKLIEAPL